MKKILIAMTAVAALSLPTMTIAHADPDAAGNAAAGAAVGAAVGAGVGGTVGAGTTPRRDEVIIEDRRAPVRERTCVRDSFGNVTCQEIRR